MYMCPRVHVHGTYLWVGDVVGDVVLVASFSFFMTTPLAGLGTFSSACAYFCMKLFPLIVLIFITCYCSVCVCVCVCVQVCVCKCVITTMSCVYVVRSHVWDASYDKYPCEYTFVTENYFCIVCVAGQMQFIITSTCTCTCLLYTSPSPRDATLSRMPSSA